MSGTATGLMRSSYAMLNSMCMVSTSLSSLTSLTKLDLRECNLNAIPNDICCLSSLKYLDLSGNNFGCLPKSIAQLSFLRSLCVENCTSLRSLPKLPLNIGYINGYGCTSLETVPDLLEPNSSIAVIWKTIKASSTCFGKDRKTLSGPSLCLLSLVKV